MEENTRCESVAILEGDGNDRRGGGFLHLPLINRTDPGVPRALQIYGEQLMRGDIQCYGLFRYCQQLKLK
jgi:hypothetical protein